MLFVSKFTLLKSVIEVEEKKSITLLETPLYKGISRD